MTQESLKRGNQITVNLCNYKNSLEVVNYYMLHREAAVSTINPRALIHKKDENIIIPETAFFEMLTLAKEHIEKEIAKLEKEFSEL